jgi:hypothetical protein
MNSKNRANATRALRKQLTSLLQLIGSEDLGDEALAQQCTHVVHVEHCSQASNCGRTKLLLMGFAQKVEIDEGEEF